MADVAHTGSVIAEPGQRFDKTGDSVNVVELVTRIVTLAVDATARGDESEDSAASESGAPDLGLGLGLE